jgi:hypothetical protein
MTRHASRRLRHVPFRLNGKDNYPADGKAAAQPVAAIADLPELAAPTGRSSPAPSAPPPSTG